MARKLQIEWQEDEQTLYELYKRSPKSDSASSPVAATPRTNHKGGVHYRTVQRWVSWYRQGGLSKVLAHRHGGHGGPERRLMPEQEAELKAKAEAGEIRTIWDGVDWARQAHQVEYTYWGMRWVFARLELKKKVPRPRSPKASATEQEAWKKGG